MIAHINNPEYFKWTKYPDGQISLNLMPMINRPHTIVTRCSNYEDLMKIVTLSDVYEHNNLTFNLFCPYVMASRSDSRFGYMGSCDIKVITNILNSTKYKNITIFDPHSGVLPTLLRNCEAKTLWDWAQPYLEFIMNENTILARNGKVVFRPDSGDPVDIICGNPNAPIGSPEHKGVIQLLWNTFGGTVNSKGYKVLDSHVGAIYGDSITLDRAQKICQRLMDKGFASTNIVFGIGSFTYQYNTRDTFGFAIKSTWCQVDGEAYNLFKDPITDDGTKKSATGLLMVGHDGNDYYLKDNCTPEEEKQGYLQTIFENGKLVKKTTLSEIRNRLFQNREF